MITLSRVDDFGAGPGEPNAATYDGTVMKWTDGNGMIFVWELSPKVETNLMFYWVGFPALGLAAQPLWAFPTETSCTFSIGNQYNYDPAWRGSC